MDAARARRGKVKAPPDTVGPINLEPKLEFRAVTATSNIAGVTKRVEMRLARNNKANGGIPRKGISGKKMVKALEKGLGDRGSRNPGLVRPKETSMFLGNQTLDPVPQGGG